MSPTNSGGPPCPKPERLEELIDFLTGLKEPGTGEFLQEVVEALDWLHTHLSNRRTYHKLHQRQQKIAAQMLRERFPEDMKDVRRAAENQLSEPREGLGVRK
jgi:hypothetical protein